jgi:hypothetical protein
MPKNDLPPAPVIAMPLAGIALAIGNGFLPPALIEAGAQVLLLVLVAAAIAAFGYASANLVSAAALLDWGR